jgi:hypothetical protein
MIAAPVALLWTVYWPEYGPFAVDNSTSTVAAESEPCASILPMCMLESSTPASGGAPACEPGDSPSAAYADSVSPFAIEIKYCRTTLPAKRANALSATTRARVGAGTGVATSAVAMAGCAVSGGGSAVAAATAAVGRTRTFAVGNTCAAVCNGDGFAAAVARVVALAAGVGAWVAAARDGAGEAARGVALCVAAALGVGAASGGGASVTGAMVGSASGVDVASATVCEPCLPATESPAPITKPKITTPIMIGKNGSERPFGGVRRVRRGGDSCMHGRGSLQGDGMLSAKRGGVIRVPVPIDAGTIAETASSAFALATPLRVDRLLTLAVLEALGTRAPQDKRDRGIRRTLAEFAAGSFVVDVDGRVYDRPDAVVVCTGVASLRFFSTTRERAPAL